MKLPYHMTCMKAGICLYRLSDGRFQVMEPGELAPAMIGYQYVLVEQSLADYLEVLDLPRMKIVDAVIYDPRNGQEIRTHRELRIGQRFSQDMIRDIDLDGERLLLMDDQYVFVSPRLKDRLKQSPFRYLQFSEGLGEFASGGT